jgi:hypothetical protein
MLGRGNGAAVQMQMAVPHDIDMAIVDMIMSMLMTHGPVLFEMPSLQLQRRSLQRAWFR